VYDKKEEFANFLREISIKWLTHLIDRVRITVVLRARSSMVEQWPFKPLL